MDKCTELEIDFYRKLLKVLNDKSSNRGSMAKIQIRYENEIEKLKILEVLSKGVKIINIKINF